MKDSTDKILDDVLSGSLTITQALEKTYEVSDYRYVGVKEFHMFSIRLWQRMVDVLNGRKKIGE